jgi:antitoxin component YwqK of YwqJK toxin-antitoxin module
MIKRILNTIVGLLLYSICISQHNPPIQSAVINIPSINSISIAGNSLGNPGIILPGTGGVTGYDNGVILFSGNVRKHRLHGQWQSWYANQVRCDSGRLVKGVPSGEWKHWNSSGQLIALRTYDANRLQRVKDEIRRNHPKETVFPLVALHRKNSAKANRYMQAGYSFGYNGFHYRVSLEEAVKHNITDGNRYRPLFDECLHHGLFLNYYDNGMVRDSGYYKYGLRNGVWIHREKDGSYESGLYKNGMKQQEWKVYDANNNILSVAFFDRKGLMEWEKKISRLN